MRIIDYKILLNSFALKPNGRQTSSTVVRQKVRKRDGCTEDFWVKALFKVLVMDIVAFIEVIMVVVVAIVLAVVVPSREG